MKNWTKIPLISVLLAISFTEVLSTTKMFNKNDYSNMFVLGDSLSDTGAFVQYQGHFKNQPLFNIECASTSYGILQKNLRGGKCELSKKMWKPKTLALPFYQQSFTNGPVAVENVARRLQLHNFKTASISANEFDNFGYNYATGSAKVLSSKELVWLEMASHLESTVLQSDRYNLVQQAKMLKQHHKIIKKTDLLLIIIGSNDVLEIIRALLYLELSIWKTEFMQRLNKILKTLFEQVKELIDYGFKRVIVANIPDLSKVPRFNIEDDKRSIAAEIVAEYNSKFDWHFNNFIKDTNYFHKIKKFDIRLALEQTLLTYKMANKNITDSAVDIDWTSSFFFKDNFEPYYVGDANDDNINNYAFFDDVHPTKGVHQQVSDKLYEIINSLWLFE